MGHRYYELGWNTTESALTVWTTVAAQDGIPFLTEETPIIASHREVHDLAEFQFGEQWGFGGCAEICECRFGVKYTFRYPACQTGNCMICGGTGESDVGLADPEPCGSCFGTGIMQQINWPAIKPLRASLQVLLMWLSYESDAIQEGASPINLKIGFEPGEMCGGWVSGEYSQAFMDWLSRIETLPESITAAMRMADYHLCGSTRQYWTYAVLRNARLSLNVAGSASGIYTDSGCYSGNKFGSYNMDSGAQQLIVLAGLGAATNEWRKDNEQRAKDRT